MFNNLFHEDNSRKMNESDFLKLNLDDVFIIDVRNAFELGGGYLKCANNIPFTELLSLPSILPKDKIILTYCNYGNRAGRAALALYEAGYNAYSLGGYALFSRELKNKCG